MKDAPGAVLAYWFGDSDERPVARERFRLWFGADRDTDDDVRRAFRDVLECARRRSWDRWTGAARERLAWIVLLDQISRHVYRGSPAAYTQDAAALALCQAGLANGDHAALPICERLFFGMPFQHAEDATIQRMSVEYFEAVASAAPAALRAGAEMFRLQALRHRRLIDRFGRFPHRNAVLGRPSTPEEIRYLASTSW